MSVCEQNHFHLQHVLSKIPHTEKGIKFLKGVIFDLFKKQQKVKLPRCCGCAYVMGYKDGLNGTTSDIESVPFRDVEKKEIEKLDGNITKCPYAVYQKGLDDGMRERLRKTD